MKISWLGTASILVESSETKLLFDPYLKLHSSGLPPFPLDAIADADAIFITHPHLDHFADMPAVMERCAAPVYVCSRGREIAREQGFDAERMRTIAAGDVVRLGGVVLRAYQCCHCVYDRPILRETLSRALRPSKLREGLSIEAQNRHFSIDMERDVLGYEICAEGKRVFLLGSANCREDVAYPTGMDLLIYPYQGRSDMDTYSLRFLERFRPKRVMLDHFDDAFPPVSAHMDCAPFVHLAQERFPEIGIGQPVEGVAWEV